MENALHTNVGDGSLAMEESRPILDTIQLKPFADRDSHGTLSAHRHSQVAQFVSEIRYNNSN